MAIFKRKPTWAESFPNIPVQDHIDLISKYYPIFPTIYFYKDDTIRGIEYDIVYYTVTYHNIFISRSKERHQEIQHHNSGNHEINWQHKGRNKIIFWAANELFLEK